MPYCFSNIILASTKKLWNITFSPKLFSKINYHLDRLMQIFIIDLFWRWFWFWHSYSFSSAILLGMGVFCFLYLAVFFL